jgi:hypothetical protein
MKRCVYCGKECPDSVDECPFDQQRLESSEFSDELIGSPEAQDPGWFPSEVLLQIALWLAANLVMAVVIPVAGVFLVNLATACWAAIDCSKMQTRGSRVLGMPFKPVVVFTTCTCLLWGLGFAWYLVMRYRVKTAPMEPGDEAWNANA